MSKELVLYPPIQPLLEHDLPLWLEEGEEDEVYSAPLCTVEATRGGPQTEYYLIENLIQNPSPVHYPWKSWWKIPKPVL